eukprot:scaffold22228_cov90-Isochrysis_galbana.AAC.1
MAPPAKVQAPQSGYPAAPHEQRRGAAAARAQPRLFLLFLAPPPACGCAAGRRGPPGRWASQNTRLSAPSCSSSASPCPSAHVGWKAFAHLPWWHCSLAPLALSGAGHSEHLSFLRASGIKSKPAASTSSSGRQKPVSGRNMVHTTWLHPPHAPPRAGRARVTQPLAFGHPADRVADLVHRHVALVAVHNQVVVVRVPAAADGAPVVQRRRGRRRAGGWRAAARWAGRARGAARLVATGGSRRRNG